MSIANYLTLVRLVISPVNVWCIVERRFLLSGVLFVLAVVSDVFDGIFARRHATVSRVGGILDHSADCLFVSSAMFALAYHEMVPIFLPILVVMAFVQYVLDSRVFQKEKLVPSRLGRLNGICYFVIVGIVVGEFVFNAWWVTYLWIRQVFSWVLIFSTVLSIGERLVLLINRKAVDDQQ